MSCGYHATGGKRKFWNKEKGKSSSGGGWDDACNRTRHLVRSTNFSHFFEWKFHTLWKGSVTNPICSLPPLSSPSHTYPTSHPTCQWKKKLKSAIKPSVSSEMPPEEWIKSCPWVPLLLSISGAPPAEHRSQSHGEAAHWISKTAPNRLL